MCVDHYGAGAAPTTNLASSLQSKTLINPTPPMGWGAWLSGQWNCASPCSSWGSTESEIRTHAQALISSGLSAFGYNIVVIDGDPWNTRDANGNLIAIPEQFPDGMPYLVNYIHSLGLKVGLYGSPGLTTCSGAPGQYGHETADAGTLASWGIDYWYYDWCNGAASWGSKDADMQNAYQLFWSNLQSAGLSPSYLVNAAISPGNRAEWFQNAGATTVRVGNDIGTDTVDDKGFNIDWASYRSNQQKGYWLDPDMLVVQMQDQGNGGPALSGVAVTDSEGRTQMNHWSILAAPLILGGQNLTPGWLTGYSLETLSNPEVIAVDQDALGVMGYRVSRIGCGSSYCEVWVRQLSNGWALELVNRDTAAAHNVNVNWSQFRQRGPFYVRDLWAHNNLGQFKSGYNTDLPAGLSSAMFLLTVNSQ
jgi:alpha-galactosidase